MASLYIHQDGFGSTGVCFLFFRRSARCWLVLREDEYSMHHRCLPCFTWTNRTNIQLMITTIY